MAEFGFLGVRVITWRQTPRRKGDDRSAGDFDLKRNRLRPLRTNWLMVGMSGVQPDQLIVHQGFALFSAPPCENGVRTITKGFCHATSI
jgi:hypothetical protein